MKSNKMVLPATKPRNPTVMAMATMKAGSHKKSNKAKRKKDKQSLKKETSEMEVSYFEF